MAATTVISRNRIRSLLEFNLRRYRVGGYEYDGLPGRNPSGTDNIKAQTDLSRWKQEPDRIKDIDGDLYVLRDGNQNLRDAIADTILDIFSGVSSDEAAATANGTGANYYAKAAVEGGSSDTAVDDATRDLLIEAPTGKKITLKAGDNTIVLDSSAAQEAFATLGAWTPDSIESPTYYYYTLNLSAAQQNVGHDDDKTIVLFYSYGTRYSLLTNISYAFQDSDTKLYCYSTTDPGSGIRVKILYKT